ncbi:unnamed protein product [Chrysoparadoxa australica]
MRSLVSLPACSSCLLTHSHEVEECAARVVEALPADHYGTFVVMVSLLREALKYGPAGQGECNARWSSKAGLQGMGGNGLQPAQAASVLKSCLTPDMLLATEALFGDDGPSEAVDMVFLQLLVGECGQHQAL